MAKQLYNNVHAVTSEDVHIKMPHVDISPRSLALCIRQLMQNWRQGTVACKDRGEVLSRSNKKPWKQKGTGRARAGSPRSPLWRGGGIAFGPQERVRTLKVSKSVKRTVFSQLLASMIRQEKVLVLNWMLEGEKPKTAQAYEALHQAQLHSKKVLLFVDTHDILTQASFANLENVRMLYFDQPNVYAMADSDCWVFLQKDMDFFKEMAQQWL